MTPNPYPFVNVASPRTPPRKRVMGVEVCTACDLAVAYCKCAAAPPPPPTQLERAHQGADMTIVTFLLLLVIAAIAAGAWVLIAGWSSRLFAAAFVAFALLLVLPNLLPKLLGG
jgi:hypothetical protein